jgi:hypothetical protein
MKTRKSQRIHQNMLTFYGLGARFRSSLDTTSVATVSRKWREVTPLTPPNLHSPSTGSLNNIQPEPQIPPWASPLLPPLEVRSGVRNPAFWRTLIPPELLYNRGPVPFKGSREFMLYDPRIVSLEGLLQSSRSLVSMNG